MMRSFFGSIGKLGRGLASSAPLDPEAERQQFGSAATISELGGIRPDAPSPLSQGRAAERRARVSGVELPALQPTERIRPSAASVQETATAVSARRARLRLAGLTETRRGGLTGGIENDIRGGEQDARRAAANARRKRTLGTSVKLGEPGG